MEELSEIKENVLAGPQKGLEESLEGAIPLVEESTTLNVENVDSLSPLLDKTDQMEGANVAFTYDNEQNQSSITNESKTEGISPIGND